MDINIWESPIERNMVFHVLEPRSFCVSAIFEYGVSKHKNSNAHNKFSRIHLFVKFSCLTQEFLVIVKIFLYSLVITVSNFREIERSGNILSFFQWDVKRQSGCYA